MTELTRRRFLGSAAAAVAATGPFIRTGGAAEAASGTVRVAVIGLHGRGGDHLATLRKLSGVEVTCLCDVDSNVLKSRQETVEKETGKRPAGETDLRKVFERKDVDAVTIATPNHWHALAAIWAMQAGKDVYVEKPGAHSIFEGRKMIEAAARYGRMVQHGVQLRSNEAVREAVDHLRNGTIGKVYMSRGLVYRWRPSIGHKPDLDAPPANLDWNLWQGPAQERKFSERIVHYNWHWHWNYGNGDVGNQGIHETDLCLWGLGLATLPSKIVAMGGKFLFDDDKECPETMQSGYYFPDTNQMIEFEVRPWCTNDEAGAKVGNLFYGEKGVLVVKGYGEYQIYFGQNNEQGPGRKTGGEMELHMQNWVDAIRTRDKSKLHGPVETAHTASALAHLGNIAFRTGRALTFDPKTERFVNDPEADKYLKRDYRAPFVVPEKV
jgi:predicted dehydrogenase